MKKSKSRKKPKRRRTTIRRRLTKSQQALAEQWIPLANRYIWERALKLPKWIMDAVGADGFIEAALTAATEAALNYDPKKARAKNKVGFPTHLFWRCRNAYTKLVHSTLRQIGANPDDNGIPQRSPFYIHHMRYERRENRSDLVEPEDKRAEIDFDPKMCVRGIIDRVSCPLARKILTLRFVKLWSLDETAVELNMSKEWVRVLQNRATMQLREHEDLRCELDRYLLGSPSPSDILSNGKHHYSKRRKS